MSAGLGRLHPALASRVVRRRLDRAAPDRSSGRDHIDAVLALATALKAPRCSLPGRQRSAGKADGSSSRMASRRPSSRLRTLSTFPLSIPGEVARSGVDGFGTRRLSKTPRGRRKRDRAGGTAAAVAVAGSVLKLPLAVRSRRPGDRFRPLGMGGRGRKLQDFLVDRKVATK